VASAAMSRYPYVVGAASAVIKIRGAPYHIAPEGAPTEAEPLHVKNPFMRIYPRYTVGAASTAIS